MITIDHNKHNTSCHGLNPEKTMEAIRVYLYYIHGNDPYLLPYRELEEANDDISFLAALRRVMNGPLFLQAVEFVKTINTDTKPEQIAPTKKSSRKLKISKEF